jgi:beta-lactamase class A
MVKVPILVKIFDKIEAGALTMDSVVIFNKALINYPWKGDDALARFKDGEDITISKLLTHMITFSDNHASLWLQDMAGSGTAVNTWLEKNAFAHTRVNSRTVGREAEYEEFGWGQTTPREMAELLVMIRDGRAVSPSASADIYRHLTRIYWDDEALSQIPPTVQAASKQGEVSQSRSEVVLVNAPSGDYVFCIITNNQADKRFTQDNEGFILIRSLSNLLWQHFEL